MTTRVQHALEQLKNNGVRITPQRHAILTYLLESLSHPTADEIYRSLEPRFPNMSVATVYNNLKMLMEAGMVRELTYGDNSSRFDADVSDHYHVICERCGKIKDFSYPSLEDVERKAEEATGFQIQGHRLELYGVCSECRMEH
ncbi:peroxide-responsive transcriptional repressor PerR [Paenibacillus macerans]|uniref:peroxide-responsive transcriptional repressor PerR n=1 Tax=Paenibacillus macerans TaxID=44252 RepID=UPI00203D3E07|nr:peroxide-responsive transcriptional repressor PerR [Paenibacillus macerans]MCM3704015.1 peroxide-responsive transcriptional repressor PerR [Paenibacillus macerans]